MTGRTWCPFDWLDEAVPSTVSDPSQAIRLVEDSWIIASDEWLETEGKDGRCLHQIIAEGEVVCWSYSEDRGSFTVVKDEDGSPITAVVPPADANNFWRQGDSDSISPTLEDFVEYSMETGEEEIVHAYYWSDAIPHRFVIEEGQGRFVRCDSAN